MGIFGALRGIFNAYSMENVFKVKTNTLVKLREQKGYTQEKMGELLLMDRSNYGKVERGERELTLRMAYKIAELLDSEIEAFVNLPAIYNHIVDGTFTNTGIGANVTIHNNLPISDKIISLLEEAVKLLRPKNS